jgi:hypothetical protein
VLQRLRPRTQALINCATYLTGSVVMLIVAVSGLMTAIYWIEQDAHHADAAPLAYHRHHFCGQFPVCRTVSH